ncbi:MAG: aspartyl/asparaginyl beta-hydroxylase [Sphingomonas bacterium]|nr:aspartyl/asparaginyl beta-hydroxylase [Sphingomonas bacterium]
MAQAALSITIQGNPVQPADDLSPIERFRAMVSQDQALQDRLAPLYVPEQFHAAAIAAGAQQGIQLDDEMLYQALKPDPLGVARWSGGDASNDGYPPRQWLPTAIVPAPQGAAVSWAHFAGEPLSQSFFESSARIAGGLPINRLLTRRSTLQSLINAPAPDDALKPDGFIFHMSRCGSTLAAQMIAALPGAIVASEAAPIDSAVQLNRQIAGLPLDIHVRVLRAIVAALGRNRADDARRYVIKLDAWHIKALPLFRAAFPDTPWVFMYRDPVEIMVSQKRQSGMMAVPGEIQPDTFAANSEDSVLAHGANVLGQICRSAVDGMAGGGGILVNYNEMPGAVPERILPHFGMTIDATDQVAMETATRQDVKSKDRAFVPDGADKRAEATPDILAVVAQYMAAPYTALEALRLG